MTSAVDICNMALSHIGERADVNSIDPPEASVEAQRCAQFYPISRRMALQMLPKPTFALKRVATGELSASNTIPSAWEYGYALPSDVIRVLGLYDPGEWRDETTISSYTYEIGDGATSPRIIYSNVENAVIRYVFDQTDTTKWPPLFVIGVSWLLAGFLAGPTVKGMAGAQLGEACTQKGIAFVMKAGAEDGNQNPNRAARDDGRHVAGWIDARGTNLRIPDGKIIRST